MKLYEIFESSNAYDSFSDHDDQLTGIIKKLAPYKDIINSVISGNSLKLYRGMKNSGSIIFGDGDKLNRRSANTTNFYTWLIDALPAYNDFPKRSKSFICTTSLNKATRYGNGVYTVIPLENQNIAFGNAEDFWFNFEDGLLDYKIYQLSQFNSIIEDILMSYNCITDPDSWDEFRHVMDDLESKIDADDFEEESDSYSLMKTAIKEKGWRRFVEEIFDPNTNGITTAPFSSVKSLHNVEVWLSGKVLFVNDNILLSLSESEEWNAL